MIYYQIKAWNEDYFVLCIILSSKYILYVLNIYMLDHWHLGQFHQSLERKEGTFNELRE